MQSWGLDCISHLRWANAGTTPVTPPRQPDPPRPQSFKRATFSSLPSPPAPLFHPSNYSLPPFLANTNLSHQSQWPAPSKPHESPPEARPLGSSSPLRLPESRPHLPVVSRSPTGTGQEPSLSVRSEGTRSPLSSSSESSPSSVSSVRLPRTSRPTSDSSPRPSWPSRRPLRLTSSLSSRTPTWLPSTPDVSPSSPVTLPWPAVSVVSEPKQSA